MPQKQSRPAADPAIQALSRIPALACHRTTNRLALRATFLQWQTQHDGQPVDHGQAVAAAIGATPVYLRYNTGQHISSNGHELSALLEQLAQYWPMPLESITVIAHSMGGLLIRSAVHSARAAGLTWPDKLKSIVFLGTPHHGAPLERAGHWIDQLLGATPWSAPFTRLTGLRSAGITDLRYGFVSDEDWGGKARPRRHPDTRQFVPLPIGVDCYTVAATTAAQRRGFRPHSWTGFSGQFGWHALEAPSEIGRIKD